LETDNLLTLSYQHVLPAETRDQEDQAKAWYDESTRALNRLLLEENLRLKRLLREAGIPWDDRLIKDPNDPKKLIWGEPPGTSATKKYTRNSRKSFIVLAQEKKHHLPTLPVEIQLQILKYAMTSKFPIIDPLCKLDRDTLSLTEKARGNEIAIGFLATCKAFHVEGTRHLWCNNTFTFTNPYALLNFANLSLEHRKHIKHINLRIIARYYDDEHRRHEAPFASHVNAYMRTMKIKPVQRPKENTLARSGYRSYAWYQVVDFLRALLPPYDPNHPKNLPRPRLLPGLKSMRMDFVNFPDSYLTPGNGSELHNLASHDLGCTLDELQLTGVPADEWGAEMTSELKGMVKDDGLLMESDSTYVFTGNVMRSMQWVANWDAVWRPTVVRSWKVLVDEYLASKGKPPVRPRRHGHLHFRMPPAPQEEGHPESKWKKRRTVWKRVLKTQNVDPGDETREWAEFDRLTGEPIYKKWSESKDKYDPEELKCSICDSLHGPNAHY
jgi:hypothetical protein